MKRLICLVMLVSSAAAVEDMSGKMIIFPESSDENHVEVSVTQTSLSNVTVCHRSLTDLKRSHSFFSLTTPDVQSYAFQTCYSADSQEMSVWVKGVRADFGSLSYEPNAWHAICATWDSSSGLVQLWMDGRALTKKYNVEFPITGQPQVVLGQEQSKYDSLTGFIRTMSFMGMLTDVHMWSYVLSACEIQNYMAERSFTPGNVVNWAALDSQTRGRLMVHDKQICPLVAL